ncbi:MAG: alkaline phosphatase family protein [Thermoproteota archaeon]
MSVFMELDRIQHFFWKYVDQSHPKYEDVKYNELVKEHYVKIDKIMGEFMRSVDEDTFIIIVSDHGFCPVHTEVFLNNYLEEHGFLVRINGEVDVKCSKAISYGYGDIWLNIGGREPEGMIAPGEEYEVLREEIADCLMEIENDKGREEEGRDLVGSLLERSSRLDRCLQLWISSCQETTDLKDQRRYINENPRWSGGHDGTHDSADVLGILGIGIQEP